MAENELLDELIDESLHGATAEQKFAAKLANCSDAEFQRISRILCRAGDEAQARAAAAEPQTREVSESDRHIMQLDNAEFSEAFGSSRLGPSLSEGMRSYRRKLGRE